MYGRERVGGERVNITNDLMTYDPMTTRVVLKKKPLNGRNDIVSVAAIGGRCTADFPCWSYPTCCVASLRAGPVGCILYYM